MKQTLQLFKGKKYSCTPHPTSHRFSLLFCQLPTSHRFSLLFCQHHIASHPASHDVFLTLLLPMTFFSPCLKFCNITSLLTLLKQHRFSPCLKNKPQEQPNLSSPMTLLSPCLKFSPCLKNKPQEQPNLSSPCLKISGSYI